MKPFNLEEALSGKAVMLRNGKKAYVRYHETELAVEDEDRLLGYDMTNGMLLGWGEHGNHMGSGGQSPFDIIGMHPETRIINGFEVPAPETVKPVRGTCYYTAAPIYKDFYGCESWDGIEMDWHWLERGLVFLNKEGAIANAKAMLNIDPHS